MWYSHVAMTHLCSPPPLGNTTRTQQPFVPEPMVCGWYKKKEGFIDVMDEKNEGRGVVTMDKYDGR